MYFRTVEDLKQMINSKTNEEWLAIPESRLAAAVNGEVFLDNAGGFTAIRTALCAHYPEDVRLWLLAAPGDLTPSLDC